MSLVTGSDPAVDRPWTNGLKWEDQSMPTNNAVKQDAHRYSLRVPIDLLFGIWFADRRRRLPVGGMDVSFGGLLFGFCRHHLVKDDYSEK